MGSNLLPRDIDEYTKRSEDKNRWKWLIRVDKIRYRYVNDVPVIGKKYTVLPEFLRVTTSGKEQEMELIDILTTNGGKIDVTPKLVTLLKNWPDQLYRLTVFKQSKLSKILGKENYAFWGWCLVSKHQDKVLWETRYFQLGALQPGNLDQRDPQDDARRKHYSEIPSGGIDYAW